MPIKKRILHIIESITVGGAEKLLCNTIRELPGYEHLVVTLFDGADPSLLPEHIGYVSLRAGTKADLIFKKRAYLKTVREFRPDIVHSHLYFATVLAKAFTPSSIPLIFTQHFEFSKNASKWYYRFLDRIVSRKEQLCIAVSHTVREDYVRSTAFPGKTFVIGNYIPDQYFHVRRKADSEISGGLRFVALGNIKPVKNQRYILDAFTFMKDLNVSCDIYGEGAERKVLEEEARSRGVNVYFRGIVRDSGEILPLYDIYLMPSLTEGFPLALFEAMAVGLPVVVSDIPVFHELLEDQGNYIPLNDPAALRNIVEYYLTHPDKIKEDGVWAKNFAIDKASRPMYLKNLEAVYQKVLVH